MLNLSSERALRGWLAAFAVLAAIAIGMWAVVVSYATKDTVKQVVVRQDRIERPSTAELRKRIELAIDSLDLNQRRELGLTLFTALPADVYQSLRGPRGRAGKAGRAGADTSGATGATGPQGKRGRRGKSCIEELGYAKCRGPAGRDGRDGIDAVPPTVEQIVQEVLDRVLDRLCQVVICLKPKPR